MPAGGSRNFEKWRFPRGTVDHRPPRAARGASCWQSIGDRLLHFLIPLRIAGKQYDPAKPPSRWAWRTAWRKLTEEAGLEGLRPHDLRHHAITKLAESSEASEQTVMAIAGHVSREMLEHYSHIRQQAKRKAVASLDNVTITSQLAKWEAAKKREKAKKQRETNGRDGQI
jgi:integrase